MTAQSIVQLFGTIGIGVVIGHFANYLLTSRRYRKERLYDAKVATYADFLSCLKKMHAYAGRGGGIPDEMAENLFGVIAKIELIGSGDVRASVISLTAGDIDPSVFKDKVKEIIELMRSDLEKLA